MGERERAIQFDGGVGFDEVWDALATSHRRELLIALQHAVRQGDEPIVVEAGATGTEQTGREIQMIHVHLPKLESYGFITWDRDTNRVWRGPNFQALRSVLELLDDHAAELPPGWL
jgi:predicted transcriptional regulator